MSQLNNELFDLAMSEEAQPLMSAVLNHIRDNVDPITEEFFALNKEKEDRWSGTRVSLNSWKAQNPKKALELLPADSGYGSGLTNLDYAYISRTGQIATCLRNLKLQRPGHGQHGWSEWALKSKGSVVTALLDGEIRSAYAMTRAGCRHQTPKHQHLSRV